MESALRHRGPDDQGQFLAEDGRVGLTATRLAILDLSPAGHQPMCSADGRLTIAFNGEIYNFAALRAELEAEGARFRSGSDTEVILQLYERRGPACVESLRGMFAFAIWDARERTAFLARDPLGIKPLYFFHDEAAASPLVFASELRTLLASGLVPRQLYARGLYGYFRTGAVPEPDTLIKNVACLEAGGTLFWQDGRASQKRWWRLPLSRGAQVGHRAGMKEDEAIAITRAALLDSVSSHFVSDVPVGIFLSGGLDSTALLALARAGGRTGDLRTFSIGFAGDTGLDESDLARRTAAHFDTKHIEQRLNRGSVRTLFDEFLTRVDQPSVDGFNTFTVSRLAHEHGSKVVLSGLGGDELFGGYPTFRRLPRMLRGSQALGLGRAAVGRLMERYARRPSWRRLGEFLRTSPSLPSAYTAYRGIYTAADAHAMVARYTTPINCGDQALAVAAFSSDDYPGVPDAISALETEFYMRNQLLRDSDVMSMACGLELRVPFVDRILLETLAGIPALIRLQPGKHLLVQAVPEIPDWIKCQPKRGFLFPFQQWLDRDWLNEKRVAEPDRNQSEPALTWYQRWTRFVFEAWWEQVQA